MIDSVPENRYEHCCYDTVGLVRELHASADARNLEFFEKNESLAAFKGPDTLSGGRFAHRTCCTALS